MILSKDSNLRRRSIIIINTSVYILNYIKFIIRFIEIYIVY